MAGQEREKRELETLVFRGPEQAREFAERVDERSRRESGPGAVRQQEAVGQEVAAEMARHGEAATVLSQPWEHTREEHEEVQGLVDMAFEQDLSVALKKARASESYPRNIDLLHDVLTSQLYEILQQRGINKQPLKSWPVITGTVVIVVVIMLIGLLLVLS
jgi:hypothetical protein